MIRGQNARFFNVEEMTDCELDIYIDDIRCSISQKAAKRLYATPKDHKRLTSEITELKRRLKGSLEELTNRGPIR